MASTTQSASGLAGSTNVANAGPNLVYSQGGGKTKEAKALNSAIQINPNNMVDLLKSGQQAQQQYYQQGLQYYTQAVNTASQQIQQSYNTANATLQPISIAGQQAMAEQMKMLGLQPISLTSSYANRLNGIGVSNTTDLQNQIQSAENLTDPAARAAAKQDIISKLNTLNTPFDLAGKKAALVAPDEHQLALQNVRNQYNAGQPFSQEEAYLSDKNIGFTARRDAAASAVSMKQDYNAKVADLETQNAAATLTGNKLQGLTNDYNQFYSPESQKAYTGEEVGAKLASTPGYENQLASGTAAIARRGAAVGMLNSGNTLASLLEYGQGLAANTFSQYMGNLNSISGLGAQFTNSIANNQVGEGAAQSSLATGLGSAGAQTYNNIGNSINSSNAAQANLLQQTAQANAAFQYNQKQANLDRQQAASNAALGATAGIMNAGTNAAAWGYNVYQNQQQANSFAANSGASFRPSGYWQV
ncbi:MAG: hypothetical protein WCP65_00130 [Bacteroidota bacterium]